jgi:hypothetical protein
MRTLRVCVVALILTAGMMSSVRADEGTDSKVSAPETMVFDAKTALEFLRTLSGEWERAGGSEHGAVGSTGTIFRVSAAGSLVHQTIAPGSPNEMINTFHMDGENLLMTHYCALQNQPRMKFEKSDKPGEIKFVFDGGTNFDPAVDAHVHSGVFKVKDKNTIESDFAVFANGKLSTNRTAVLKRKSE